MTRAYLGLAALDALYLLAGLGLLVGFGHVRSLRSALRLAGLAFTVGWAAAGVAAVLLLVAGLSLAPWQLALACVALAAAGAAASFVTPRIPEPRARAAEGGGMWFALVAGVVVLLYLELLGMRSFVAPASYHSDAWGFWLPKAKAIALFGGLDTGPGGVTSFTHADYPPLLPALDAVTFRFMGGLHASVLPLQEWVFAVAFVAALAALLAPRVPAVVLWPCLALVVLTPSFGRWVGVGLADLPLAFLFALAGVAVALWLTEGRAGHVALACTLLAAAALTKVEGRSLGLALAGIATLASIGALRRRWAGLVALAAAPVLAERAWREWLAANDVPLRPDYRVGDALDIGFLLDRTDRLEVAIRRLPGYLVGGDDLLLVLPLALAAALLVARRSPALALLVAGTPLVALAGLVVAYWVSVNPVEAYIDTSAERAVLAPFLFAAALLPLALATLLAPESPGASRSGAGVHGHPPSLDHAPDSPSNTRESDHHDRQHSVEPPPGVSRKDSCEGPAV
jgi:hypothetical protein